MSIAEKLTAIAENEQKVYDAGRRDEMDAFWDIMQNYGDRPSYMGAFRYWQVEYLHPKYKIVPDSSSSSANAMCQHMHKLKKAEAAYIDLSNVTGNNARTIFNACREMEEVEDIGFSATLTHYATFYNCHKLHTIAKLRSSASSTWQLVFGGCSELVNVTFEGVIGQSGIDLSGSPSLSHDSIISLINCLETKTSGTWTVTLGTNKAKMTEAELQMATDKGWTVN